MRPARRTRKTIARLTRPSSRGRLAHRASYEERWFHSVIRPQSVSARPYRLTIRVSGSRPWEHRGPVVQLGVHAALSRRRSRVQIPSGPLDTRKGDEEVE